MSTAGYRRGGRGPRVDREGALGTIARPLGNSFRRRSLAAALVVALSPAAAALAQPAPEPGAPDLTSLSLDELLSAEVVYAASRRVQSLREAPSAVTVVTAAQIRQHGYRTLADVLRTLPSFYVTYDRNYSYVGVRGFDRPGDYSARVLLLVNGLRTNDNIYGQSYVGNEFQLDLDLVDRIEVVRGPSAAVYGNSAFFAVVNVITKRGRDLQGTEIAASGGTFAAFGGRASWGRRLDNGLELLLSASLSESAGPTLHFPEFEGGAGGNGVVEGMDDEEVTNLFASASKGSFSFEASHVARDKGIPTASFGTAFGDPRTRTMDAKQLVSVTYSTSRARDHSLQARLHYGHYRYEGDYGYGEPEPRLNRDWAWGTWWGLEASLVRRLSPRHVLTAGGELCDDVRQQQFNFDVTPRVIYQDSRHESETLALFAQDEVRLTGALTLNLGLRYDWYASFGQQLSPRAGAILRPAASTTVKLLYGRAFRAPNDFELHYDAVDYRANPDVGPEKIRTLELVVEHTLAPDLVATASGYLNRIQDLISLRQDEGTGLLYFDNADDTDSRGLEVGLEARRRRGPSGSLSYAWQRSVERAGGGELTNSPRHMAKAEVALALPARLAAAVNAQYLSSRRTLGGGRTGPFVVVNATLSSAHIFQRLFASASVYNLFDRRYSDPGSEEHVQDTIEQDGRSLRVKLAWRF